MKKEQMNQLTMHHNVQSALNENAALFGPIGAYVAAKAQIDNSISIEQDLANKQMVLKSITTTSKTAARNVLAGYILDLSSKLMSFALVKGDNILYDTVKLNQTVIRVSPDNILVIKARIILSTAQENIAALADYNVTAQTLTEGDKLLEDFNTEIQKIADNKNSLKQITELLNGQIKITNRFFKPVDSMVETMRKSNWAFYCYYRNARTIKKAGGGKVAAKGKVFDSVTKLPMPGAQMSIVPYNGNTKLAAGPELVKNVKIKSTGGGFQLKSLPTGTYLFKVTYSGYADQETIVYINEGVLTKIDLPLTQIA